MRVPKPPARITAVVWSWVTLIVLLVLVLVLVPCFLITRTSKSKEDFYTFE
jgi:hypothetical protein